MQVALAGEIKVFEWCPVFLVHFGVIAGKSANICTEL